jgi:hypothetical protein
LILLSPSPKCCDYRCVPPIILPGKTLCYSKDSQCSSVVDHLLACVRPWIQSPVPQKNLKKKDKYFKTYFKFPA